MILVLHSDKNALLATRRMLFSAGILSMGGCYRYALTNPREDRISAVLIPDPYDAGKPLHFCESFHARYPHIPVIALASPFRDLPDDIRFTHAYLNNDVPPSELIENLLLALYEVSGKDYALCMEGLLRDHLLGDALTWGTTPLPLTPTERAIVRYLLMRHPSSVGGRELLRYCTKPGTEPTLCNIPSHIYRINLKAEEAIGHHIIGRADSDGYRLLTDLF
jgi:DNA-binding response OmpR family regulator